jgi:hypothetical protein
MTSALINPFQISVDDTGADRCLAAGHKRPALTSMASCEEGAKVSNLVAD